MIIVLGIALYVFKNISSVQPTLVVEQEIDDIIAPEMIAQKEKEKELMKEAIVLRSGSFLKIDAVHKGIGEAIIFDTSEGQLLKFEDFKVTRGPDLFVYLSKNTNIKDTKDLGEFISLGRIKSNKGTQMYNLPDNADEYNSIVIWCRAFGVVFSVAELK